MKAGTGGWVSVQIKSREEHFLNNLFYLGGLHIKCLEPSISEGV